MHGLIILGTVPRACSSCRHRLFPTSTYSPQSLRCTIGLQTRIFGTGPLNLETIWHEQVTRSLNACAMLETRLLCELRPTFGPQFINLPQGCSLSRPAILTWGTQWCLINMTLLMIYGILPPNPHPFRRIR